MRWDRAREAPRGGDGARKFFPSYGAGRARVRQNHAKRG